VSLTPLVTGILDAVCIAYLFFHRSYTASWKLTKEKNVQCKTIMFVVFGLVSIVSSCYAIWTCSFPYLVNLCRPIIMLLCFMNMRRNIKGIFAAFMDNMLIILSIMVYIVLFSGVAYSLYRSEMQGLMVFTDLYSTTIAMYTMVTTANYPDVFLPAYFSNWSNALFFLTFLTLCLYLFLNLLLANVFNMYIRRIEEKQERR
jgi:two pore calcium channel protein 3